MKKNVLIKPVSAVATSVLLLTGNMLPVIANEEKTDLAQTNEVQYESGICQKGKEIVLSPQDASRLMNVKSLSLDAAAPKWIQIDETGKITCNPTEEVLAKTYMIPVMVTYNDDSKEVTYAKLCVMDEMEEGKKYSFDLYNLSYKDIEVKANETEESALICKDSTGQSTTLPEGTTLKFLGSAPSWITLKEDGSIVVNPSEDNAGQKEDCIVEVTYADGSSDAVLIRVSVKEKEVEPEPEPQPKPEKTLADTFNPSYPTSKFLKTDKSLVEIVYDGDKPESASYDLLDSPEWVTINKTTGELTINGSESIVAGTYGGKVLVNYTDASTDEVAFKIEMVNLDIPVVESIKVSPSSVKLAPEETYKLEVSITPDTVKDAKLTFSSLDNGIATVNEEGIIKAVKEGKTTIVVRSENGKIGECAVEVANKEIPIKAIHLSKEYMKIGLGDTHKLKVYGSPDNATEKVSITWSVSDPSILSMDSKGNFTGIKTGTAKVTATTNTGLSASCEVKVLKKRNVETGTQTNSTLYIAGAAVAGIALVGLLLFSRKKK
ncbi:MAG: Rib/alpha-like domain-containing protein [Bacillota bacterium]|nr:Rib/alpha-like domain-containing protein [Bacillota bacterium]